MTSDNMKLLVKKEINEIVKKTEENWNAPDDSRECPAGLFNDLYRMAVNRIHLELSKTVPVQVIEECMRNAWNNRHEMK